GPDRPRELLAGGRGTLIFRRAGGSLRGVFEIHLGTGLAQRPDLHDRGDLVLRPPQVTALRGDPLRWQRDPQCGKWRPDPARPGLWGVRPGAGRDHRAAPAAVEKRRGYEGLSI